MLGVARSGGGRKDGGRAGWGVYPRAKTAPRRTGCRRPRPALCQALGPARRLPHWGRENGGERIRHARSLRRGGRCDGRQRCRCGKRAAETVPVRMTGGCHQAQATGTARKGCHACAPNYLPATPSGRPVPEPVWRAHARAASASPRTDRGREFNCSGSVQVVLFFMF
jgi:hypothetical protein